MMIGAKWHSIIFSILTFFRLGDNMVYVKGEKRFLAYDTVVSCFLLHYSLDLF